VSKGRSTVLGGLVALLTASTLPTPAIAIFGAEIRAECSVATTGDIADSVINVVCGMPPDQVAEIVRLAASPEAGDRAALMARLDALVPATSRLRVEAIAKFFELLGEAPVETTQLADRFADLAERHRNLLDEAGTLRVADPEVQAKREAAYAALNVGNHDKARAMLDEARQIVREKRETLTRILANQQREEAALVAEQAAIERARLRYREAAALYREAADLRPPDDTWDRWMNLLWAANALQDLGREYGDNAALAEAIASYETAFDLAPQGTRPDDWATTQNNLGVALLTLGARESGTATLERAVQALEAALLKYTRQRVPLDWAMTQNNLGIALRTLGARESGTATLERAVQAFEAALLEYTRERVPLDWAMTQNNLGAAFLTLGARESGTATLERAVHALEAALLERSRERVPHSWAHTHGNLAIAGLEIGRRRGDADELRAALVAVDGALEEYRASEAVFYIEKAELLRDGILAALGEFDG
jgi:tetratricopeptide (TPR) repeat protein